jgi:glycerol-3-phosphate dehydrogenase (NAD(P)+)
MSIVTIIGAGMMGSALCWPLSDNHHTIRLVGTFLDEEIIASVKSSGLHPTLQRSLPEGVTAWSHTQIPEALQGADLVVSGVSSFGVDWFYQTAGEYLTAEAPVIAVTKGLEDQPNGDLLVLPVAGKHKLPARLQGRVNLNAIGGPCISHELAARRQTGVVFCGKDRSILERIKAFFATDYYHIWPSTDLVGVEVCAALKNAYALGVGLAVGMMEQAGPDGLANMYNPQAALFGQSCFEMQRLEEILQGSKDNVAWLPGAGDLYVTVFGGRTVRLGKMLGQGVSFAEARRRMAGETLESVEIITRTARALPKLASRGLVDLEDFPLMMHMNAIINHAEPINIPWDKFFQNQEKDAYHKGREGH